MEEAGGVGEGAIGDVEEGEIVVECKEEISVIGGEEEEAGEIIVIFKEEVESV